MPAHPATPRVLLLTRAARLQLAATPKLQRYFLDYALGWVQQQRDEELRRWLLSNVHSPYKWRVVGPLSNIPAFHGAFGVKPGQPSGVPTKGRYASGEVKDS